MRIWKGAGYSRGWNGKSQERRTEQDASVHGKSPAKINFAKIIDL
jgi:hypothetical protein